jgi:hypothetical protein
MGVGNHVVASGLKNHVQDMVEAQCHESWFLT